MSTILFSQSLKKPNLSLLVALALGASVGCTRTHRGAEPSSDMNQSSPVSAEADFWSPSGDAAASSSKSVAAPQSVAPKDRAEGEMADDGMAYRGAPAPGKMSEKKAKGEMAQEESPVFEQQSVQGRPEFNTESYDHIQENRFVSVDTAPLSTFSVDVDTAAYSNMRRFVSAGVLPPAGAVRIEELINYFDYDYEGPKGDAPFSVHTEVGPAPWAPSHRLLHIGLQGKRIATAELPPRNLVFLLDVSGSMNDENKLPLLKRSFKALLETLSEKDTVSIVVYAGASGMVLPPTNASQRATIISALDQLEAGGSTNGGEGIELAYQAAAQNFRRDGVNRVIVATDGDFNIGVTNQSDLVDLIEKKRDSGIFLTVLGFGMGNYKDSTLEKLADKGNGNYAYIDSFDEAKKVLVEEGGANLVTIAKDVKIQLELNPSVVGAYRLIGYENRVMAAEDFNDDKKDAGEIGAGHTVTALYELLSPEDAQKALSVDGLKYRKTAKREATSAQDGRPELGTVKLRFKTPMGHQSRLLSYAVSASAKPLSETSNAFRFSASVASFGMLLRGSQYAGEASFADVRALASGAMGRDRGGYRSEFIGLVARAGSLGGQGVSQLDRD